MSCRRLVFDHRTRTAEKFDVRATATGLGGSEFIAGSSALHWRDEHLPCDARCGVGNDRRRARCGQEGPDEGPSRGALEARGTVGKVETVTKGTTVTYEAVVEKNGKKTEVAVNAAGKPIKP